MAELDRSLAQSIVERLTQIAERVQEDLGIPSAQFLRALRREDWALPSYLPEDAVSLEGYLFPATYTFPVNAPLDTLVARIVAIADRVIAELRGSRGLRPAQENTFFVTTQEKVLELYDSIVGAFFLAFAIFRKNPLRRMPKILEEKWRVDELYDAAVVRPVLASSRALWRYVDNGLIDGTVNGAGRVSAMACRVASVNTT